MSELPQRSTAEQPEIGLDSAVERRRPGRVANMPETLIPLLNGTATLDPGALDANEDVSVRVVANDFIVMPVPEKWVDSLAPARGILIGIAVTVPVWIAIGLVVYWVRF